LAQLFALPERDERETDRIVQASKQWLERHTDWLLIMDNADDLQLARSFFPVEHQGHILLTTRSQIVGNVANQVEIEEMETTEAVLFLLRRVGMVQGKAAPDTVIESVRETARQLVELLGRHPLALDQAGAYIEETGVTFAEYTKLYQNERRFLLERRGSLENDYSEHPEAVATTFQLCFQKVREGNPLATDLLRFCAFLQPDAIPEELFHADGSFAPSTMSFNEGITTLRRYSLVKRNAQEKAFSIHRLVQAVLVDGLSPGLQTQWRQRALQAVRVLFPVGRIKITEWERCDRLLPHILACVSWPQDELISSVSTAQLFHEAVIYLFMRGRYAEAESLVQLVLLVYKHHYGADHPVTASALESLSAIYSDQHNDEAAYLLTEQALAIREKHLGADHPQTAWSILSLASMCLEQGHYKKSEELLIQATSILEKHAATAYVSLAAGLCQLAHIYLLSRKDEQAEPLLQRAVSIFEEHPERQLGPTHPRALETRNTLEEFLYGEQHTKKEAPEPGDEPLI
jgi:tetratricopeptide (TPR) repeat protein